MFFFIILTYRPMADIYSFVDYDTTTEITEYT